MSWSIVLPKIVIGLLATLFVGFVVVELFFSFIKRRFDDFDDFDDWPDGAGVA